MRWELCEEQERGNDEDRGRQRSQITKTLESHAKEPGFYAAENGESFNEFSQESDIFRHLFLKTHSFEMRRA